MKSKEEKKKVKCNVCKKEFEMPINFIGSILCEDCDPFMTKPNSKKIEIKESPTYDWLIKKLGGKATDCEITSPHKYYREVGVLADYIVGEIVNSDYGGSFKAYFDDIDKGKRKGIKIKFINKQDEK